MQAHRPGSRRTGGSSDDVIKTTLDFTPAGDDKIYFSINIPANNPRGSDTPAVFNTSLSPPLLDIPDNYYLSVVRFNIPTQNIPIVIAQIPDPAFPNNTNLWVTLLESASGTSSQQQVIWVPENLNIPTTDPFYYYSYCYTGLLEMVNTALETAFAAITTPGDALPPYFQLEPEVGRISLVAQKKYYETGPVPATTLISIGISNSLLQYLNGLPQDFLDFPAFTNPLDSILRVIDFGNNTYVPPNTTAPANSLLRMEQEFPCLSDWNCIQSIRVVSDILPVRKESIVSTLSGTTGSLGSAAILQDFIPNLDFNAALRTNVQYFGESMQLINMYGQSALNQISVAVYWVDRFTQESHLLYVPYGQVFNIKFAFIKKSTYV